MREFKMYFSKTFTKILIYISLMVVILVLFLSSILYRKFEKVGLKQAYENNEKMMVQVSYNISYFDEIVRNFAVNEFFNPNNQQLMYSSNDDYFYIQRNINLFQQSIQNNSIFHSALLYNKSNHKNYSTYSNGFNTKENLEDFITSKKNIPSLKPIPRILPKKIYGDDTEKVFTYFMYDNVDYLGNIQGGVLILNVKIDWLLNVLKKYSSDNSNIFIINSQGHIILDAKENYEMFDKLDEDYFKNIIPSIKNGESKIIKKLGKKQVMTYKNINDTGWILVRIQPYEDVFKSIVQVKNETLIATVAFIILALMFSIIISELIYKPFGNVVKQIKTYFGEDISNKLYKDDADYISQAFKKSKKQIKEFEKYKISTKDIIKENTLKLLLLENNFLQLDYYKGNELIKTLSKGNSYLIIIFNIDDYIKYKELSQKEKDFIKFVIINIANELFGNKYEYNKAYIGKGQYVYLISIHANDKNQISEVKQIIKNIQKTFQKITEYTLSTVISDFIEDASKIYEAYKNTNEAIEYKMVYGNNCILEYRNIKSQIEKIELKYPNELEKNILQSLKLRKLENTKQLFEQFIEFISQNSVENIKLSILQLSMAINKMIKQIRLIKDNIDFQLNYNEIMQIETLQEIKGIYYQIFDKIIKESENLKNNNHYILIKSIKEYIQRDYAKEDISLQLIADEFKMSSVYLGQVFKDNEGLSILEYINKVRLKNVAEMLLNTNYNIKYIIEAVGYCNESNFYKLFKKEFGLTPNSYRKKWQWKN